MINVNEIVSQCEIFNISIKGLTKEKFEEITKLLGKDIAYTNIETRFNENKQKYELNVEGIYIRELNDIIKHK